MDCKEARPLLEATEDGELDLVRQLDVEAHLRQCPSCAALAEGLRARRAALCRALPRYTAPIALQQRVLAAIRQEAGPEPTHGREAASAGAATALAGETPAGREWVSWMASPIWRAAGLAASLLVAWGFGYRIGNGHARGQFLFEEAVSDHIRSLQFNHLSDVTSTDQHTVKPWFAGRLDFAPPVADLAAAGFPLTGGRLEHLDGHPAAALVFRRRQHAINLFIWPAERSAVSNRAASVDGYQAQSWSQNGFNFLAVSEIGAFELSQFASAYRASL